MLIARFTMVTVIIVYDTKYGQTQRIAEYVGDVVRRRGHKADVVHVLAAAALQVADGIVVLAPVFMDKHMDTIRRFVMHHHQALNRHPSAFFSVSGSAESTIPDERARAHKRTTDFVASTPWRPQVVASLGGAIDYRRYNPFLRLILKFIAKRNGGPADTSRNHELTNWRAVERATLDLVALLEPKEVVETAAQTSTAVGAGR